MKSLEITFQASDQLMGERRWAEAKAELQKAISGMPTGWMPTEAEADSITMAFWDRNEFLAHIPVHRPGKTLYWIDGSYSKAWYLLAFIEVEESRLDNAMVCIDSAMALEPDHPILWTERGFILNRLGRCQEALSNCQEALNLRSWAPKSQLAQALCGQGSALISMGRIDDAEVALQRSLALNESTPAKQELAYIDEIRSQKSSMPWFVRAVLNPPTDPLTLQLVTLVEDLPSIPGPRTVGAENYSEIAEAFVRNGWTAFEQAFDQVFPRTRTDYAVIKRDLLREDIFRPKVHAGMTRRFALGFDREDFLNETKQAQRSHGKPH